MDNIAEPPSLRERNLQVPIARNPPPPPGTKPKRRRKEWVYKSQYDRLQEKYDIVKPLAISGWLLAFITIALNMIFWFHR